jgi:hypothetical protein
VRRDSSNIAFSPGTRLFRQGFQRLRFWHAGRYAAAGDGVAGPFRLPFGQHCGAKKAAMECSHRIRADGTRFGYRFS